MIYDVAVVGGGASGIMAALAASKGGRRVVLIEQNDRLGKKIVASGNGRCNYSNTTIESEGNFYMYNNPKFVSYALSNIDSAILRNYFESIGLLSAYEDDRVYPSSFSSSQVIDVLRQALEKSGVNVKTGIEILGLSKNKNIFTLTSEERSFHANAVIVATGSSAGISKPPKYFLSEHTLTDMVPSMLPIHTDTTYLKGLQGVRANVKMTLVYEGDEIHKEEGEILFKDFGVSGMVTFCTSVYLSRILKKGKFQNAKLYIDFLPQYTITKVNEMLMRMANIYSDSNLGGLLVGIFHKNISANILAFAGLSADMEANYNNIHMLSLAIKRFELQVTGLPNFKNAQIVSGGYNVAEFSKHSFESKRIHGLFVVGEALDIDGICGGFNLHWAFASGLIAGRKIGEYLDNDR